MTSKRGVGNPNIRVGRMEPLRTPGNRRWLKIALPVGLILLVIIVASVVHHQQQQAARKPLPVAVPQYDRATLDQAVYDKLYHKDYNGAITLIKGQKTYDQPATKQLLITVYMQQKDYQSALNVYAELDQAGALNASAYAGAGDLAAQTGQYALARQYYQKAITSAKQHGTGTQDDLNAYQERLNRIAHK